MDIAAKLATLIDDSHTRVPPERRLGIAVVGAGAIVDFAHLPAYGKHGLPVIGLFDLDSAKARDVAERHDVDRVYSSLDELLSDPDVKVVDIAVPPRAQPSVVHQVVAAGRHLLCQKPLGLTRADAAQLVEAAREGGVCLAVNQQLRFSESMLVAARMIADGWIGELTAIRVDVDVTTDWTAWPWLVESPELEYRFHSIHYLDTIRAVAGDPTAVFGRATRRPGQVATGETRTTAVLVYPGDLHVTVTANHENLTNEPQARFIFDGVDGRIVVDIGLLVDYPNGGPDRLRVWSESIPTDGWLHYPISTRWLPDAFIGPMAALLRWIDEGVESPTSGRDNLGTVALVDALYRSAESGRVVEVET